MGVNYSHLLIPKDNDFRPEPSQIAALIEAWIESEFIIPPEMLSEKKALVVAYWRAHSHKSFPSSICPSHQKRPSPGRGCEPKSFHS